MKTFPECTDMQVGDVIPNQLDCGYLPFSQRASQRAMTSLFGTGFDFGQSVAVHCRMAATDSSIVMIFSEKEQKLPVSGGGLLSARAGRRGRCGCGLSFALPHRLMNRAQPPRETVCPLDVLVGLQRPFAAVPAHVLNQFLFAPSQFGFRGSPSSR